MTKTDAYVSIVAAMKLIDGVMRENVNGIKPDMYERIRDSLHDAEIEMFYSRRVIFGTMSESERREMEDVNRNDVGKNCRQNR